MRSCNLDLCFSSRFSVLLICTNIRAQILIHCNYSHWYQRIYRYSKETQMSYCADMLFWLFSLRARINDFKRTKTAHHTMTNQSHHNVLWLLLKILINPKCFFWIISKSKLIQKYEKDLLH